MDFRVRTVIPPGLLDTNALSEIVKHPDRERAGFLAMLGSGEVAPCFTPYNLIELRGAPDVFEGFLALFSDLPIFLTFPWEMVLDQELARHDEGTAVSPLLNAFSPNQADPSYDLRGTIEAVLDDPETKQIVESGDQRAAAREILDSWLDRRKHFMPTRSTANAKDARRYVEESGLQTLIGLKPDWMSAKIKAGDVPDVHRFPTLAVMLYSQYWRFWDPSWVADPSDVRDIQIMAVSPYMDLVVTEKRQAEVFRKVGAAVPGVQDLQVMKLRHLRDGEV